MLRLKNGIAPGDETVFGQTLPDALGFKQCLDRVEPLYREALASAAKEQGAGLSRGVGLATVWFGPGRSAPDQSEAWAELLPDGILQVWIGAADMGQGSDTMFWQIASQAMGWPLERVRLCTTDTGRTPDGNFSAGSRQTYVSGRAVELAVAKLRKAMEDAGASTYEEMKEQGLSTKYQVVHKTQTTKLDPQTGQGVPWETYSFGVQMAEVAVDTNAGKYEVLRLTAVHDMGTVINRLNVEGQLHGGMVMGLGYAVSENYVYNQTNSLAKFRIPRASGVPPMEVHMVQVPRANGPFGASGTGEFADVPTAPAIANAIANACSIRLRSLPLDLKNRR